MALAPKTKLWIGLGVFVLVVFGLLSLKSDTFSGNLSLIPMANPGLCKQLKEACDAQGPTAIACENYKKMMCDSLQAGEATAAAESTESSTSTAAADESTSSIDSADITNAPRRARTRSAAPQPTDEITSDPLPGETADDTTDATAEPIPNDTTDTSAEPTATELSPDTVTEPSTSVDASTDAEQSTSATPDETPAPAMDDLDAVLELYPEAASQGQQDTSEVR